MDAKECRIVWVDEEGERQGASLPMTRDEAIAFHGMIREDGKDFRSNIVHMSRWCEDVDVPDYLPDA